MGLFLVETPRAFLYNERGNKKNDEMTGCRRLMAEDEWY